MLNSNLNQVFDIVSVFHRSEYSFSYFISSLVEGIGYVPRLKSIRGESELIAK